MKHKILGLLVGGVALLGAATTASAANVTVEIEGQALALAPAAVTTPAHVTKDGLDCDGATIVGALQAATSGDWAAGQYGTVDVIKGEAHPFGPGGSWSFYVNGNFVNDPGCSAAVKDGDKVLFYWTNAYASAGYDEPELLDAPATAVPGTPFTVTARETSTYFGPSGFDPGVTTITPSSGATISGGAAAATTGADGKATVTVAAGGPYTLIAKKGNRAPARISGCATTGSDGFCGTTKGSAAPAPAPAAAACVTNGHDGFCGTADTFPAYAKVTAVAEGRKYAKGKGPRELAGSVESDASGLADVRLRLTRNDQGQCSTYDGKTEAFKTIKKCGAANGVWFSVGSAAGWKYLLPSKLARGRYVLDVQVVDKAGNKTTQLARGTSRVVFTVA